MLSGIRRSRSLLRTSTRAAAPIRRPCLVRYMSTSDAAATKTVGFIGLGNMGFHMASNLLSRGVKTVVFDLDSDPVSKLVTSGATKASSATDVATKSNVLITMLPGPAQVESVYFTHIVNHISDGTLCIDSSTIDPITASKVAERVAKFGGIMVDAPVSGGVTGARDGTLTFMVGGTEEGYKLSCDVLQHMGKNVVHCGGPGMGQTAKICNNLTLAIQMAAVSEGMNLGRALGMDPKTLASIYNTSTSRSWSSDTYNPCPGVMDGVPSSRGYTGGFAVDLMKKDLGLALKAAEQVRAPVVYGSVTHQIYTMLSNQGKGKLDFSVIYQWIAAQEKESK